MGNGFIKEHLDDSGHKAPTDGAADLHASARTPEMTAPLSPGKLVGPEGETERSREMSSSGCACSRQEDLLKFRIAAAIGETADLAHALEVALKLVCTETGWSLGEAWIPCEGSDRLQCCKAWYSVRPGFESFRCATEKYCFGRGEDLPGTAWDKKAPVFIPDVTRDPNFRRGDAAAALGIKAGAAFPVLVDDTPVAVLEFFMLEQRSEDKVLISLISAVTAQLGAVLQRKETEERLRDDEAELRRVNEIKDHFMAILAHELRNPLGPMLNAVALLRSPNPGDAVDVIERQVKHVARLVDDLLDLSRVTRGKIALQMVVADLVEMVRATTRIARFAFVGRRQHLTMDLPSEPLWVKADPVRIEQVLGNLLNNAVKYTDDVEEEREIRVTLTREENMAVLRIRDQGIGIPAEMQERIFEPFVQLEHPHAGARGGLGLGLSLVRQFVEMHGGTVSVFSEGVGRGAEFLVRLPMAEPPAPVSKQGILELPKPELPPVVRRRVLILEDSPDLANTLARLLVSWGHDVEVASTGIAALEKALEFRPDVALIDLGLPGVDGCTVASQLNKAEPLTGIQLIAMTGYETVADRARASEAGFHEYLLKPVDPAILRDWLRK